jgi:hypothetical protein
VDLNSKRLVRRLQGLHDRLEGLGFREAQVRHHANKLHVCAIRTSDLLGIMTDRGCYPGLLLGWRR